MPTTVLNTALCLLGLGALLNVGVFVWLVGHTVRTYAVHRPASAAARHLLRVRAIGSAHSGAGRA